MQRKSYYIYVDGSFSNRARVGVAGFMVFDNARDHEAEATAAAQVQTFPLEDKSNIRVELRSALLALNYVGNKRQHDDNSGDAFAEIYLYTDCATTKNLPARQKKLVASAFISKRTGRPLHNADLYRQFFELQAKMLPTIFWIKGHTPKQEQTFIERNFSFLDRVVRKELRGLLGRHPGSLGR